MRAALLASILLGAASASPVGGVSSLSSSLGLASWDLEGYGKDNPIGPTTGGKGGKTVTVSTAEALLAAVVGDEPKTVYVKGTIALPERLNVGSNKSLLGVGSKAGLLDNGISITNVSNVIVRNLKISKTIGADNIALANATRVWIDHNEFESELSLEVGSDYYVRPL